MSFPPPGQDPNYPQGQQPQQPPFGQPGGQPGYGVPQPGPYGPPPQPGYGPGGMAGADSGLADWPIRAGGYLIDFVIVLIPSLIVYALGSVIADFVGTLLSWPVSIAVGLWLAYQEGTTGQTPGKKVVGIRLVNANTGQYLGFGMAVIRKLAHILDSIPCYVGWLWPLWDSKKQTFADKVCGTVVVRAN